MCVSRTLCVHLCVLGCVCADVWVWELWFPFNEEKQSFREFYEMKINWLRLDLSDGCRWKVYFCHPGQEWLHEWNGGWGGPGRRPQAGLFGNQVKKLLCSFNGSLPDFFLWRFFRLNFIGSPLLLGSLHDHLFFSFLGGSSKTWGEMLWTRNPIMSYWSKYLNLLLLNDAGSPCHCGSIALFHRPSVQGFRTLALLRNPTNEFFKCLFLKNNVSKDL